MKFSIKENEKFIGEISLIRRGLGWTLTDFFVAPEFRGMGYGRKLLATALNWADEKGLTLTLRIRPYGGGLRPGAGKLMDLYESVGFTYVKRSKNQMRRLYRKGESNGKSEEVSQVIGGSSGYVV